MTTAPQTYRQARDLVRAFYMSGPGGTDKASALPNIPPKSLAQQLGALGITPSAPSSSLDSVVMAILNRRGDFARDDFDGADLPVSQSRWYKPSAAGVSEPAMWTMDDMLSSAGMLAFGMPGGAVLAAGISVGQRLMDNQKTRAAYNGALGSASPHPPNQLADMASDMKSFITDKALQDKFASFVDTACVLRERIKQMMVEPEALLSSGAGFNAEWIKPGRTHYEVLGEDWLGQVWTMVDSLEFNSLLKQDLTVMQLDLRDNPSAAMCTIDSYCQIMTWVVNAITLYAQIVLMPPEALRPGWDPKSFDLMAAIADGSRWDRLPADKNGRRLTKTAKDAFNILYDALDPNSATTNFMTRVRPSDGDAVAAFRLICNRLDSVSFGHALPAFRDKLWFLPKSKTVEKILEVARTGDFDPIFYEQCDALPKGIPQFSPGQVLTPFQQSQQAFFAQHPLGQSEVKDAALCSQYGQASHDAFLGHYNHYQTTLTMVWNIPHGAGGAVASILTFGVNSDAVLWQGANNPYRSTPWRDGASKDGVDAGGYDQVCWCPDDGSMQNPDTNSFLGNQAGRDLIGWLALVLSQYAGKLHYGIDPATQTSTVDASRMLFKSWSALHGVVVAITELAPQAGDAARGAKARS